LNHTQFTEASKSNENLKTGYKFTSDMAFVQKMESFKCYQVMDHTGKVLDKNHEPKVSKEFALNLYKKMAQMYVMDGILYEVQRQGRISFYATHYGEEATIGTAAALNPNDMIYGQVTIIKTISGQIYVSF
jgi:2-oxoisovalerate dehydrogenase E1 component alpha subunit